MMNCSPIPTIVLALFSLSMPACNKYEQHKIVVSSPRITDLTITHRSIGQVHSQHQTKVLAPETGYLETGLVKEGQAVKESDVIFKIIREEDQAKLTDALAESRRAQLEFNAAKEFFKQKADLENVVAKAQAELTKADAKVKQAQSERSRVPIKAPMDGIVGHVLHQHGSHVHENEALTTLSDNREMRVDFYVTEHQYLEYVADDNQHLENRQIELVLPNGDKYSQNAKFGAIDAPIDSKSGRVLFRADYSNPDGVLREGQSVTVLIHRFVKGAVVIPQWAILDKQEKQYVYVVDNQHVAHQREIVKIVVENELGNLFAIENGLNPDDMIVVEGYLKIHDGEKVEYEVRQSKQIVAKLK